MNEHGLVSHFNVKFDGLAEIKFRSCHGMSFAVSPVYYPDPSSVGRNKTGRGSINGSEISFSLGTIDARSGGSGGQSIVDWLFNVLDFDEDLNKRNGRISLTSAEGDTIAQWKILNAWPCRWDGPALGAQSNQLSIDSVTFVHEGLERVK